MRATVAIGRWRAAILWVSLAMALAVAATPARAQLAPAREYEIKAGFLFNFAKFVDWPAEAFDTGSAPMRLVVIGRDPFDGALERLVAGKLVHGHPVAVAYVAGASQVTGAHIAFIAGAKDVNLATLLPALTRTATLTVSDIDRFAEQGGVIGLVAEGSSIRFVINRGAAARARLQVSSRLLSLATVIDRTADRRGEPLVSGATFIAP